MSNWFPLTVKLSRFPVGFLEDNGSAGIHLVFPFRFWQLTVDALPPQDARDLEENLGIERDTPEHIALEQGSLCQQLYNPLKRKRL